MKSRSVLLTRSALIKFTMMVVHNNYKKEKKEKRDNRKIKNLIHMFCYTGLLQEFIFVGKFDIFIILS
jgi:hypothetical protein